MRFAYADPPYLCGAHLYKKHHPEWHEYASVDGHARLIRRMLDEYPDGWALSMSSVDVQSLSPLLPSSVRWGAWVKPFAVFKPNVNPGYCWEPVAFFGGRKMGRDSQTVRDFIAEPIAMKKGLTGAKPLRFCLWVLEMLGFRPVEDALDDLFPGTGIMGKAVAYRHGVPCEQMGIQEGMLL